MDLSVENKKLIIDELLEEIKIKFPYRTDEPEKCQRDLEHIYDAIVNDYLENSDYYISIIANKFWYMNVRQIERFAVEFKIYELLETKLIELGAEEDRLSKIFDTLKNIIEHGPNETAESSLNIAASGARRCQRNWDYSKSVAKKDVVALADIAITMPSKQARTYFELIISTDQELNNFIRKNAIDRDHEWFHPEWQNNQVSAPVLFIYITTEDNLNELDTDHAIEADNAIDEDGIYAIGISSGAVALAANNMGYKTGFCRCFNGPPIQDMLEERLGFEFHRIKLMLGIGYPDTSLLYNQLYDNDGGIQQIVGYPRDCRYHII